MSLTQGINQRTLTIGGRMTEQLVFILRRLDLTNKKLFIYGETVESKRVKLETSRKPYGDPSPTVSVLWIHVRIPLKSASVFSVNCRSKRTKIIRKGRGLMHTKKKCSMGLIKAESLDNFGNTEKNEKEYFLLCFNCLFTKQPNWGPYQYSWTLTSANSMQ